MAADSVPDLTGALPRPASMLARLGRWCATRPWLVVAAWVIVLLAATFANSMFGGTYNDNFTLPNSPSEQGAALLQTHEPGAGGQGGELVFTVTSGIRTDRTAIEESVADVRRVPHVLSASDPLSGVTVSGSGRTAVATVHFNTKPGQLGRSYVREIDAAVAPARRSGVTVNYGGALGQAAGPKGKDARSALIGIVVALLVLLVGFGSVYAAGLPLVSAGLATISGLGVLGVIAATSTFPTVSPTFAVMMGLGVGIDYALFLATRHRQQLMDGADPADAAEQASATSGRAVLVAATTVVVALLALYASGIAFLGDIGLAGAIAVVIGAAGPLTLVPALLGLLGQRIDRHHLRAPVAEATATDAGWGRYARRVGTHPWRYLLGGVALLCLLAVPFFSMRLGHVDAGADPTGSTAKQAYDDITAAFGPGANGPFTIAVSLPTSTSATETQALETKLHQSLAATSDVAEVGPVRPNRAGSVLVATVIPRSSPQDPATDTLQTTLRDKTLPSVLVGTGAKGYVTGTTSEQLDFRNQITARLPLVVAVVIAIAFLLLLVNFRSPVLALKAAVLNLLSIGAAYGVIVAVFQWGWGSSLFGVSEKVPIESYVPMIMFAIVFGLSMDYEVFLLSRIREAWTRTGDNHQAVATGLAATARVITCAAAIMTCVFLAFLLSTNVVIKMLALGLGASILIDATVIRLVVVPAAMFLLGRYNWWTPDWLDRILPGRPAPREPAPAAIPAAVHAVSDPTAPVPGRPGRWQRTLAPLSRALRFVDRARHRTRREVAGVAAGALGVAVLVVFVLTFLGTSGAGSQATAKAGGGLRGSITATVGTSPVGDRSLTAPLALAGIVGGANSAVPLTPQTAGTVTSLSISAGQKVAAGQAVAQLSDTQGLGAKQAAAQSQLAQAQAALAQAQNPQAQPASVAQAQAAVASAQTALDNAKDKQAADQAAASSPTADKTSPTTVSSLQLSEDATAVTDAQQQLHAAQAELANAQNPPAASSSVITADRAAVNAAQDNLNAANQAVAQLTVTAPVAGTVAQILVPVGGYASPNNPIATFAGSTETVTAQASPLQVTTLDGKIGAHATVSVAVPDPTSQVAATLTAIAPSVDATTQQTQVTFATNGSLQSNAPVTITVELTQPSGPTAPVDAIVNVGGQTGLYVLSGVLNPAALGVKLPANVPAGTEVGRATFTPITAGITEGATTQVLSGITAGQTIVTTGQSDLTALTGPQEVAILPTNTAKPTATTPSKPTEPTKSTSSPTTTPVAQTTPKAGKAAGAGIDVTVVAVHGSSLTVSTPIGQRTFTVPAGFTVTHDGKAVPLDQLRAGDVLKVTFAKVNGKRTPTSATLQ